MDKGLKAISKYGWIIPIIGFIYLFVIKNNDSDK